MKTYSKRRARTVSESARRRANARWAKDRELRERRAKAVADQFPDQICKRIIVIDEVSGQMSETVIWRWDSYHAARQKARRACLLE